jgi:hypothetical protein
MANDRFIYFEEDDKPTDEEVEKVVRNYFGVGTATISWDKERWFVTLPGKTTDPFEGISEKPTNPHTGGERWIEIVPGNPVDVLTRQQDPYTDGLAHRLAGLFCYYWSGDWDGEER